MNRMNMQELMRQAEELQKKRKKAQEMFSEVCVTGQAGNGLVKINLSATHEVKVCLDSSLKDEELSLLEDLVAVALKDVLQKLEEERKKHFKEFDF